MLTSPTWDTMDSFTTTIVAINYAEGIFVTADPVPEYFSLATVETAGEFAVEVASLTRSIVFRAEDFDPSPDGQLRIGGHFIFFHTPAIAQTLEGAMFVNFGQQGNLGRYVSNQWLLFAYHTAFSLSSHPASRRFHCAAYPFPYV